jgi:hypothetical protein
LKVSVFRLFAVARSSFPRPKDRHLYRSAEWGDPRILLLHLHYRRHLSAANDPASSHQPRSSIPSSPKSSHVRYISRGTPSPQTNPERAHSKNPHRHVQEIHPPHRPAAIYPRYYPAADPAPGAYPAPPSAPAPGASPATACPPHAPPLRQPLAVGIAGLRRINPQFCTGPGSTLSAWTFLLPGSIS